MRAWRPPRGEHRLAGELSTRTLGSGETTTVLLHGLATCGDSFGGAWDRIADGSFLVVPDLLGFGRSMDTSRSDFTLDAHLRALDTMLDELGRADTPLTVVGHSMGSVLALHWAAHRADTQRVVAFCGPLYTSRDEAARHIANMGLLEKLFALESPLARQTCVLMCRFRAVAQWVSVAISPEWPVTIARRGVLHTWPSYLGGMNGIIQKPGWAGARRAERQERARRPGRRCHRPPFPVRERHAAARATLRVRRVGATS